MADFLSFRLSDDFVASYASKPVPWGLGMANGASFSELVFISKYSRVKDDGTKERWHEVCQRVVEGTYSILKDYVAERKTHWNANKAQRSAEEMYDRMFHFKWTPPGRGMWMMGTPMVNKERDAGPLYNCAFVDFSLMNKRDPGFWFARLLEMCMFGVGVGYSTHVHKEYVIYPRDGEEVVHVVKDSREGWAEALRVCINSHLTPGKGVVTFDYSEVRPYGAPLKRFGGIASGPEPLRKALNKIDQLLSERAGSPLRSVEIVDICNLVAKAAVSGGSRRSALLSTGDVKDDDWMTVKDWSLGHERTGDDGWAWMSNNSVVGTIDSNYDRILDGVLLNGEPGLLFVDMARSYGRLEDGPDTSDSRVVGTNPCLPGDQWVMTTEGPRRIEDLIGKQFTALVNGKKFESTNAGFFYKGEQEVYRLTTKQGYTVDLTADHKVLTDSGWVEARDLKTGDNIELQLHSRVEWAGEGDFADGYLLGSLIGDGTFSYNGPRLSVWLQDAGSQHVASYIEALTGDRFTAPTAEGVRHLNGSARLSHVCEKFDVRKANKTITEEIERGSSELYKGLIASLIDTDGSVEDSNGSLSVRIHQSDREMLITLQRMLARLGVSSNVGLARQAGKRLMPDGRDGYKVYAHKAQYRLIVGGAQAIELLSLVGLANTRKLRKASEIIDSYGRGPYAVKSQTTATFEGLDLIGTKKVYDATIDVVHRFDSGGLTVKNCGEIFLEGSGETCNLVETYPTKHESLADYLATIKHAYLYAKAVTLLPTPWPETNEVIGRNRRIGTSMTGIAEFVDSHGWPELRAWADEGFEAVCKWDKSYSEWLGVRESIRKTTIKPAGTTSTIASTGGAGVHWPPAAGKVLRRQRLSAGDPLVPIYREAGYSVEPAVGDPEATVVVTFPIQTPDNVRSEREVSVWEKAALAADMQRYWADNAVSVTLSFDPDTEGPQLSALIQAFQGKLKGMSFLPMDSNAYPQMPFEVVSDEEFEEYSKKLKPLNMDAIYGIAKEAEGTLFCDGDVCELPSR